MMLTLLLIVKTARSKRLQHRLKKKRKVEPGIRPSSDINRREPAEMGLNSQGRGRSQLHPGEGREGNEGRNQHRGDETK